MLRNWRAMRIAAPRRALSTSSSKSSNQAANASKRVADNSAADKDIEALNAKTPGITRIRQGSGSAGRVVEVDSTIARIIGSDWGDRRHQSVSLPMRIYWIIFGAVLVNGVYTYFTGKDESYLVEKVQKKVDEKLGVVETNEFVEMADPLPAKPQGPAKPTTTSNQQSATPTRSSTPVSVLSASSASASPFFHRSTQPQAPQPPPTKAELLAQLEQLRTTQQQLRTELASGKSLRDLDDVAVEIVLLDQQKAQLKRQLKRV